MSIKHHLKPPNDNTLLDAILVAIGVLALLHLLNFVCNAGLGPYQ